MSFFSWFCCIVFFNSIFEILSYCQDLKPPHKSSRKEKWVKSPRRRKLHSWTFAQPLNEMLIKSGTCADYGLSVHDSRKRSAFRAIGPTELTNAGFTLWHTYLMPVRHSLGSSNDILPQPIGIQTRTMFIFSIKRISKWEQHLLITLLTHPQTTTQKGVECAGWCGMWGNYTSLIITPFEILRQSKVCSYWILSGWICKRVFVHTITGLLEGKSLFSVQYWLFSEKSDNSNHGWLLRVNHISGCSWLFLYQNLWKGRDPWMVLFHSIHISCVGGHSTPTWCHWI